MNDFDAALAGAITETIKVEDGRVHHVRTQDVEPVLKFAAHAAESHDKPYYGDNAMRFVGTIPLVLAEQWAMETGTMIGTKEYAEVVKKRLMNGDFAKLRVKGI